MHPVRVNSEYSPHFARVWETYEKSFPESERRLSAAQKVIFSHPNYRLDAWFGDQGDYVGLMDWWEYDEFRYVEHIAIAPEARSGGMGSKILASWMALSDKPVFLEIDPVTDEISQRRLNFYQRLGFVENAMEHVQPHFQGTGESIPLRVLSYPQVMSDADYARFRSALSNDVWAEIRTHNGS